MLGARSDEIAQAPDDSLDADKFTGAGYEPEVSLFLEECAMVTCVYVREVCPRSPHRIGLRAPETRCGCILSNRSGTQPRVLYSRHMTDSFGRRYG